MSQQVLGCASKEKVASTTVSRIANDDQIRFGFLGSFNNRFANMIGGERLRIGLRVLLSDMTRHADGGIVDRRDLLGR